MTQIKVHKTLPPTYFVLLLLISLFLHFFFPYMRILTAPYTYSGFLLISFGITINIWADMLMKREKTTVKPDQKPTALITYGPFSFSRNPQYLGFTATLLGISVCLGTFTSFVSPIVFALLMQTMFIPLEEKNLQEEFGRKYIDYKNIVRSWI